MMHYGITLLTVMASCLCYSFKITTNGLFSLYFFLNKSGTKHRWQSTSQRHKTPDRFCCTQKYILTSYFKKGRSTLCKP